MTHSRLKPFMAYLEKSQYDGLARYSKKSKISMSHLVREAISMRISTGDQYLSGFNDGLDKAMSVVSSTNISAMRFPSGMSFEEIINGEIASAKMEVAVEAAKG